MGSVACLICGIRFQVLNSHLRYKHKVNAVQYRKRFPGAVTECKEVFDRKVETIIRSNDTIRRRGFKHRTQRRWFKKPDNQGSEPLHNDTDAGMEPVTSERTEGSKVAVS